MFFLPPPINRRVIDMYELRQADRMSLQRLDLNEAQMERFQETLRGIERRFYQVLERRPEVVWYGR